MFASNASVYLSRSGDYEPYIPITIKLPPIEYPLTPTDIRRDLFLKVWIFSLIHSFRELTNVHLPSLCLEQILSNLYIFDIPKEKIKFGLYSKKLKNHTKRRHKKKPKKMPKSVVLKIKNGTNKV